MTANDNVAVSALISAASLAANKLDGAVTIGLTTGAVDLAASSVIDASAGTGVNTGVAIKGGAGHDGLATIRSQSNTALLLLFLK